MGGSSYGPQFTLASALVRSTGRCERCKRQFHPSKLDAHHTIPRKSGGPDTYENLKALCDACHPICERESAEAARLLSILTSQRRALEVVRRARPPQPGSLADLLKRLEG